MQRELELARREIAVLKGRSDTAEETRMQETAERRRGSDVAGMSRSLSSINLKTIAELVGEFDSSPENFDVWQKQVCFMKATYELADDVAKTLIGMKFRKKAFDWLHSRAEHLSMTFDELRWMN